MTTFGEINWNDDVYGDGQEKKNTKDTFLRLVEGSNEMRLITQPHQYLVHKYKKEGDPGFGNKVYCSAIHGSCPLCAMGNKVKPRWLIGVIDRKTQSYKILDISWSVFQQIRKLVRNTQRWGDPSKYDIDIVVDKNGGATGYYTVQPISKEPLSAADQVIRDSVDLEDLKRRVTPPTPDAVKKRLDKLNGETVAAGTTAAAATVTGTNVAKISMDDDEEGDEDFPSYQ